MFYSGIALHIFVDLQYYVYFYRATIISYEKIWILVKQAKQHSCTIKI